MNICRFPGAHAVAPGSQQRLCFHSWRCWLLLGRSAQLLRRPALVGQQSKAVSACRPKCPCVGRTTHLHSVYPRASTPYSAAATNLVAHTLLVHLQSTLLPFQSLRPWVIEPACLAVPKMQTPRHNSAPVSHPNCDRPYKNRSPDRLTRCG